jgi:hypothetical protein
MISQGRVLVEGLVTLVNMMDRPAIRTWLIPIGVFYHFLLLSFFIMADQNAANPPAQGGRQQEESTFQRVFGVVRVRFFSTRLTVPKLKVISLLPANIHDMGSYADWYVKSNCSYMYTNLTLELSYKIPSSVNSSGESFVCQQSQHPKSSQGHRNTSYRPPSLAAC